MAATYTLLWHQWSPHVTLVTHPDHPITPEQADRLDAVGIDVVDGPAAEVLVVDDRLVGLRLADGAELAVRRGGGPRPRRRPGGGARAARLDAVASS